MLCVLGQFYPALPFWAHNGAANLGSTQSGLGDLFSGLKGGSYYHTQETCAAYWDVCQKYSKRTGK